MNGIVMTGAFNRGYLHGEPHATIPDGYSADADWLREFTAARRQVHRNRAGEKGNAAISAILRSARLHLGGDPDGAAVASRNAANHAHAADVGCERWRVTAGVSVDLHAGGGLGHERNGCD